ncbi:MAG: VCBS repeat-containing protein [Phaeodactylibacter sp.]|nr:VCBS repeat-containing protein [Phaeodactylibacter sp.]MCB9273129.1 VCBS repeat-containing protein [Lewinellaceae bacterium]
MKIRKGIGLLGISAALVLCGCRQNGPSDALFELIPARVSGITFSNEITTSDSVNILNYEYLYNGGGIGVGDFNQDGLPDLFFSGNQVPCRLYLNKGGFRFEDITAQSGINTESVWAYGVSVEDINQDGLPDIYLCAGGMGNKDQFPNKLYINQGNLTFQEKALEYGLADAGESIQAAFLDYDRDGDLDLYLLTGGGFERSAIDLRPILSNGSARNTDRLYRNDRHEALGHAFFTDVSREAGILHEGFGLGVSVIDVNDDGWPDVYATNDYLSGDHLYVNNRDGSFSERSADYFRHTAHFAMGNDAGDINNDGLVDIVALDMLPEGHYRRMLMYGPNDYNRFRMAVQLGYGHQYMRNMLQLNDGNGAFSEIGQLAGIYKTDWSWAALLADFDNDSYQDLFITNGFGKDITDLDFVKFRREVAQISDPEERRAVLLKSLEERPAIVQPNLMYRNQGGYTFEKVADVWGLGRPSISNGAAYADLDGNGSLDLVVNNIGEQAFIYKNTLRERDTANNHYLKVRLKGRAPNLSGTGSKVEVRYGGKLQARWQYPVRGYLSSMDGSLHFGLGEHLKADTLMVIWPDGNASILTDVPADQQLTISQDGAMPLASPPIAPARLMAPLPQATIDFKHQEQEFNDFDYQPLLLHKYSQEGPGIATGDVNGDGLEDIYIGGAYHQAGALFVQQRDQTFSRVSFPDTDAPCEDMGCLFFDADGDGSLDLYVVSGSSEYGPGHRMLQDRLYFNDGQGHFRKGEGVLPDISASGSCVVAGDYDGDGDLDLFVGGRVNLPRYPSPPNSYLLRNEGGKFVDATEQDAPELKNVGMVSCALWTDLGLGGNPGLIVAGEAMPIRIFRNEAGKLKAAGSQSGLADSDGFWSSLAKGDFDHDGDPDFVAGNLGLNSPYAASAEEPMCFYYADFDNNGSVEPLIGCYEEGHVYPIHSRDVISQQLPSLKKHILFHRDFARTTLKELVDMTGNRNYQSLYCKTLRSVLIENLGGGKFALRPLPAEAQMGPLCGILVKDINADGHPDIVAVGNSYATEVVTGRFDALRGVVLAGDGKNGFTPLRSQVSGFYTDGDAKAITSVRAAGGGDLIIVTQNDDYPRVFHLENRLTPLSMEQKTTLR